MAQPKHVTDISQFADKALLKKLYARAAEFQDMSPEQYPDVLRKQTIATVFYEPSTRTRLSFEAAIQNLGANLISTENAGQFSSAAKGETLEDSIRIISGYAQAIVIRHPEDNSAERAASISPVPIINAGSGSHQHPTQALLDGYSIFRGHGKIDGLTVALVGDLANGRTVHSLVTLLSVYDVKKVYFVAPDSLRMPAHYLQMLDKASIAYEEMANYDKIIGDVDVLYMTRVQKERFASMEAYDAVKDSFVLTLDDVKKMKKDAIILHPLPRVNEISTDVDKDPRAYYFQQAQNGLYVRMALLEYVFKK